MRIRHHYDYFKERYSQELERYKELSKKSQIYLSIVSLFSTAIFFNIKDIAPFLSEDKGAGCIFSALIVLTGLSLLIIIRSLQIRMYSRVTDDSDYIEKFDSGEMTDDSFFKERIADFIVSTKNDSKLNDDKAFWLILSEYSIMSITFFTVLFILKILT
jgi:hypothetical protein